MKILKKYFAIIFVIPFIACDPGTQMSNTESSINVELRANEFVEFTLTTDLSILSENERKMIPILIDVAKIMDDIFWKEAY